MSFSETWLALRAGYDTAARSRELESRLAKWAIERTTSTGRPLSVVDLGAGSGNNYRHLAPRLPVTQSWTLVDSDEVLLAAAGRAAPSVGLLRIDLAAELEAALPDRTDVIAASALIDLVSAEWLERLVVRAEAIGAALMLALTYDGRTEWQPADPLDTRVLELVNRHQRSDKGFGPALGPDAGPELARLAGDREIAAASDWSIAGGDRAMRSALVEGWTAAAIDVSPGEAAELSAWRDRSIGRAAALTVGHVDQMVLPG